MAWYISLSVLGVLVLLGAVYAVFAPRWHEAQRLQQRFQHWKQAQALEAPLDHRQTHILSDVPWLDSILRRIPALIRLERLRQQAGNTVSLGAWLLLSGVLGFGLYFASSQSVSPPIILSLGAGFVGFAMPIIYLKFQKSERLRVFQEQFPEALDMLSRTIQAGHSLVMGIQLVGEEFKEPLGPEFTRMIEQVQQWGIPFNEALQRLPERIESLDLKYFTVAVIIQREAGGNLREILESLSNLIRKRAELGARVKALSAEGKLSAIILFSLPLVILFVFSLMNPKYFNVLFKNETGHMLLIIGASMMSVGAWITRKLVNFRV